jgi:metal-responsive CopG/Arc/MetJ family transcriptional regulator
MPNTTTIAASGVPLELVEWIDEQAKKHCTNRSTIIRQILCRKVNEESKSLADEAEKEAA